MNALQETKIVQPLRRMGRGLSLALLLSLTLSLFLSLALAPLMAQGPTAGGINGVVTDPSGAVLPDVKVTAAGPSLVVPQVTITGSQGGYRFPSLPPGTYTLTTESPGFEPFKREGIIINSGFNATVDLPLVVAGQAQSVAVSAEAPLLDTENTKVQDVFTASVLRDIPNARDMWSLIAVAPGLSVTRFDVGGATVGTQTGYKSYGMTGQQRVQMDGVNMTESNGATSAYTDYSAFAEVQIGTTGNDASMPSPGVQVNLVVKSGGNMLHGDFYQDYENSSFQGRNISTSQLMRGAGTGTLVTGYHDTNGDIGGPIKKDKLWFFGSVRRQYIGTTITGYPVDSPGSEPFYTTLSNLTYKITYQLNANNRITQMLNFERKQQPFRDAASTRYLDAVFKQEFPQWIGSLEWSSTLTPNAFLNVRVGHWGYNWTDQAYPDSTGQIQYRETDNTSGDIRGGYNPRHQYRRRFQIEPTMSYSASSLFGLNQFFTFGFLTEKETFDNGQYGYRDNIQLIFASAAGAADFTTPSQVQLYNVPALTVDYLRHHGAFVQDKIKVSRHLTLNAGVRWDYYNNSRADESVRSDVTYAPFFYAGAPLANGFSIPASYPDYKIPGSDSVLKYPHSFAARLGFAWDIFGNGKTTIKASWGRYYSNPSLVLANNVNPIHQIFYTFKWNDLNGDKLYQSNELGAFQSSSGSSFNSISSGIKHPYMDDFSGFVEHEAARDFVVRAGFVYRKLAHDWALVDTARTPSLYSNPVTVNVPSADGSTTSPFTVWDIPASVTVPASTLQYQTPDSNNSYFRSIDLSASKRMSGKWSMTASYLATWADAPINPTSLTATTSSTTIPTQPNVLLNNLQRTYDANFKVFATYKAPFGVVISPIYRFQLGSQVARYYNVSGLRTGTVAIPVEPVGSYRQDNISIFDVRLEKRFTFKDRYELGLFFDAFNIGNSNASQNQDVVTGTKTITVDNQKVTYQRFLAPTTVVAPRIFRLGTKFTF